MRCEEELELEPDELEPEPPFVPPPPPLRLVRWGSCGRGTRSGRVVRRDSEVEVAGLGSAAVWTVAVRLRRTRIEVENFIASGKIRA